MNGLPCSDADHEFTRINRIFQNLERFACMKTFWVRVRGLARSIKNCKSRKQIYNLGKFSAFENMWYQIYVYFMKWSDKESLYHLLEKWVASMTQIKKRYTYTVSVMNFKHHFSIRNTRVDCRALWCHPFQTKRFTAFFKRFSSLSNLDFGYYLLAPTKET